MERKVTREKRIPSKSFETEYDHIQRCIVLKILDVEGMSPFFLLKHPEFGVYRVCASRNGLQMSR